MKLQDRVLSHDMFSDMEKWHVVLVIDPDQPRVQNASRSHKFRHYLNLKGTYKKFKRFMKAFDPAQFVTCRQYINRTCFNGAEEKE